MDLIKAVKVAVENSDLEAFCKHLSVVYSYLLPICSLFVDLHIKNDKTFGEWFIFYLQLVAQSDFVMESYLAPNEQKKSRVDYCFRCLQRMLYQLHEQQAFKEQLEDLIKTELVALTLLYLGKFGTEDSLHV